MHRRDAAGLVDALLDLILERADYNAARAATITPLLFEARTVQANIATVRRLVSMGRLTGPRADLIYQMLAVLPVDELGKVYQSVPTLEAEVKRALPDSVRLRADFGPVLRLDAAAEALIHALRDPGRWPQLTPASDLSNSATLLPETTRSLLRDAVRAGAAALRRRWPRSTATS